MTTRPLFRFPVRRVVGVLTLSTTLLVAGCSGSGSSTATSDRDPVSVAPTTQAGIAGLDSAAGSNGSGLPALSPGRLEADVPNANTVVAPYLNYSVISTRPHDADAFTQGLELSDGQLFESTGSPGYTPLNTTSIRQVDPTTGEVLRKRDFGRDYFGEGLTLVGNRIIQLSWQRQVAYIFDRDSFESVGSFDYTGEGWGLCYNGSVLYMTDGSSTLYTRDPDTFEVLTTVTVTRNGREVALLNELECVGDAVWSNVWHSDEILKIDPRNGAVLAAVDFSDIATGYRSSNSEYVLNGIAFDPSTGNFLITGKNWADLYEVQISDQPIEASDSGT